eukprot:2767343-Prymnesium_polylepis.1
MAMVEQRSSVQDKARREEDETRRVDDEPVCYQRNADRPKLQTRKPGSFRASRHPTMHALG